MRAFQDYYPDELSYCYGCGKLNENGLLIKSFWDERTEETVCIFHPKPYHIAIPGFVYGGLIASLFDCHSTGTATAIFYKNSGKEFGTEPSFRFVTASLHVDYLKPTPLGCPLEIRALVNEVKSRKVVVESRLLVNNEICAKSEVIVVLMPEAFFNK